MRKSPEESLKNIQSEEKKSTSGKLKIYLGAAPGVGKTYTMLHDAYESRKKNLDVVIGLVESHGREMIDSMISKFTIIPRQEIKYHDKSFHEFDLDAALKRNPGLILVDEMAHTNVKGLRHTKRWQDIKELLDRGIDVYTTLNVQHIESLKDDVAQIIQAPINETIPDFMLECADGIELVDLPVEDLLKRLHDGKIYIPEQLESAVGNYFRKGNLIALRELALRATAAKVETDVQSYRKSSGIKDIWPTRDKILACVNSSQESLKIIRTAKRMVTSQQAEWAAVYVDEPSIYTLKQKHNNAINNLRLAQQLGAETHVLSGNNKAQEILQYARENNVTHIIIWKDVSTKWFNVFKHHLADEVLEHSNEINVSIITGSTSEEKVPEAIRSKRFNWKYYILATGILSTITLINHLLAPFLDGSNLIMLYLLGVAVVASFGYIGPSIFTSIISVLAFDFFFLKPNNGYDILNLRHIFTLGIMLLITNVISYLTLSKHREAKLANQVQSQTRALYSFSRQLLSTYGIDGLLSLGTSYIGEIFKADVQAFIPNSANNISIREEGKFKSISNPKEQSIAQWVYDLGQPAGLGTDTLSSNDALYLPLLASNKSIGVLKVRPQDRNTLYSPEQMVLLESCVHQFTLALEVDRLQEKTHQKQLKTTVDSTKTTLLKTISHHLNLPLNSILKTIRASSAQKNAIDRKTIDDELSQVSLINNNILQIIGFESESILVTKKQIPIVDIINLSISSFQNKNINLNIPEKTIYIFADSSLMKKVFDNLLDNANKFSPEGSPIEVSIQAESGQIKVRIENEAQELTEDEMSKLFKKFYKGKNLVNSDGLGLGLTICQIIIEAHSGQIWAEIIEDKGIIAFNIALPINDE
jgi:two-component system, OmpR family, sensor histidine kinase KdpD